MDYTKDITIHIKGKHFSIGDRRELQGMLSGLTKRPSLRKLAEHFNCSPNTIRKELQRGAHHNTGMYRARRAQNDYDLKHQNSIKKSRRFLYNSFVSWVESKVLKAHWSLDACHGFALRNRLFPERDMVCVKTLYNYVDSALLKVRNIDLPLKVRLRLKRLKNRKNLKKLGRSIDERDIAVEYRKEFGHWEIDTVIGRKTKGDSVVLTLVERLTRKYIALKISGKNSTAVSAGIASLRKHFGSKFSEVFKTITSDNGQEFSELTSIENDTDTRVYFAHPYSSWERGSNERHNGLLRRFIPKGKRIDSYSEEEILFVADWCNNLPRKILGYHTPDELFEKELDKIYAC